MSHFSPQLPLHSPKRRTTRARSHAGVAAFAVLLRRRLVRRRGAPASVGARAGRPAAPRADSAADRQSQPAATSPRLMCERPALQWAIAVARRASRRVVLLMFGSCLEERRKRGLSE